MDHFGEVWLLGRIFEVRRYSGNSSSVKKSRKLRWAVATGLVVFLVASCWYASRLIVCQMIKGDFLNYRVGVMQRYLELLDEPGTSPEDSEIMESSFKQLESNSLVSTVEYLRQDAKGSTLRIRFSSASHCFSEDDVLELTYSAHDENSTHVRCKARFENSDMIPSGCERIDTD
jgi:hypothetical protein